MLRIQDLKILLNTLYLEFKTMVWDPLWMTCTLIEVTSITMIVILVLYRIFVVYRKPFSKLSIEKGFLYLLLSSFLLAGFFQTKNTGIHAVLLLCSCVLVWRVTEYETPLWSNILVNYITLVLVILLDPSQLKATWVAPEFSPHELLVCSGVFINIYMLIRGLYLPITMTELYRRNLGYKIGSEMNILGLWFSFIIAFSTTQVLGQVFLLFSVFSTVLLLKQKQDVLLKCLEGKGFGPSSLIIIVPTLLVGQEIISVLQYLMLLFILALVYFFMSIWAGADIKEKIVDYFHSSLSVSGMVFSLLVGYLFKVRFGCSGSILLGLVLLFTLCLLEGIKGPKGKSLELLVLWFYRIFLLGIGKTLIWAVFIIYPLVGLMYNDSDIVRVIVIVLFLIRYSSEKMCTWAVERLLKKGFSHEELGPLYLNPGSENALVLKQVLFPAVVFGSMGPVAVGFDLYKKKDYLKEYLDEKERIIQETEVQLEFIEEWHKNKEEEYMNQQLINDAEVSEEHLMRLQEFCLFEEYKVLKTSMNQQKLLIEEHLRKLNSKTSVVSALLCFLIAFLILFAF